MPISDVLRPRAEVREGRFQGVLQTHKVGASTDRLENDPEQLLSMTYPSNALETALTYVGNKLSGDDNQGAITINGPYGSGKSHALLALYHLFEHPDIGRGWLDEWGIDLSVPTDASATILSTSETDADRIWEPIFRALGGEDILEDISRYPTVGHIETLVGDDPTAIFFDEIETWWESFDRDEESDLANQNEFFLQNLLEVAEDPENGLFTFVTLLDKSDDLQRILKRTKPYSVDLNDSGDRERVILHRLFETRRDEVDDSRVRDIVRSYIDGYVAPVEIPEQKRYENRMVETYPFHPELLELLDDLYEAGEGRQNTRGAMGVLADTIEQVHDETDLVVTSDIDARPFRGFNQTLYDRFVSDRDEVSDIPYGENLLQTILLYTINGRAQEASVTECLLGTFKPSENSISRLDMSLRNLYGTAHYLDRDGDEGPYYLSEDPKLSALVTREQDRILNDSPDAVQDKLAEVVRDDVWGGGSDVYVYGRDEVPESSSAISVVVSLEFLSNGELASELNEFLGNHDYANTVLFVPPSKEILGDDAVIRKTARVLGAENLRGKVDDEAGELGRIIRDERRELTNELADRYGDWIKWSQDDSETLRMRKISVSANVDDVKSEVGHDKRYIGEAIEGEVAGHENGIKIASLLNDFRKFRKLPVVLDDSTFYSAIRELHRDGDLVIEGARSNYYISSKGEYPPEITGDQTIYDPDVLPAYLFEEEEEGGDGPEEGSSTDGSTKGGADSTSEGSSSTGEGSTNGTDGPDGTTETGPTKTVFEKTVSLEGPGARVLRSQAETRLNSETDSISRLEIEYDGEGLDKSELISVLESLADGDIDVELTVEREDGD